MVVCLDAAAEQLHVLGRTDRREKMWATPALGEGTTYVRTEEHLAAFSGSR